MRTPIPIPGRRSIQFADHEALTGTSPPSLPPPRQHERGRSENRTRGADQTEDGRTDPKSAHDQREAS
eukprot:15013914-Heterocapsa_arctica.AAC.1